jgi:hypothetical protein
MTYLMNIEKIIIENLFIIIKGFLLAWFIADFQPLQDFLKGIKDKISDKYILIFYLKTAVSCQKCLALWLTLTISGDLYISLLTSFITYLYDRTRLQ